MFTFDFCTRNFFIYRDVHFNLGTHTHVCVLAPLHTDGSAVICTHQIKPCSPGSTVSAQPPPTPLLKLVEVDLSSRFVTYQNNDSFF